MKRQPKIFTLLLCAALPLAAIAAEPAPSPLPAVSPPAADVAKEQTPPLFEQLDSNHDGYVSKDEAKRSAEVTARYKELDSDRDGRISAAEFRKGMSARL